MSAAHFAPYRRLKGAGRSTQPLRAAFLAVFSLFLWNAAALKSAAQAGPSEARKGAVAIHVTEEPTIDGVLNELVWVNASWTSDFVQKEPVEGDAPSALTEVALAYSEDALLVAARMQSAQPGAINALVTRRDVESNAEQLVVSLDTYLNGLTAYSFGVTAGGARIDYFQDGDDQDNTDYSFDPVWSAATRVTDQGWVAEMRIPFSQLRFNERPAQVWGLNLNRRIPTLNEDIYWVMVPKEETGWASRFGRLSGIGNLRPSRRVELLPYVAASGLAPGEVDATNPFVSEFETGSRVGLDAKMGLGPNLTLDVTVNPDFGQVEADPAVVNLTAFETFFVERRPFFAEGADLLSGGHFYSRRIGARPRGSATADFVDQPESTTILGASKLSGRLSSGMSVAAVAAATQGEYARTFDAATGITGRQRVEPFAGYGALALSQEFGRNASTIGGMVTAVQRDLSDDDPLAAIMNQSAYTGQLHFDLRFRGSDYNVQGSLSGSTVSGTAERITRLQRSPVHYFQRPDADHVELDPTITRLSGYAADVWLGKNSGNWTGGSLLAIESPGYDPNDLGRLGRADEVAWFAQVDYRALVPRGILHRWGVNASTYTSWGLDGVRNITGLDARARATLTNYWSASLSAGFNPTGSSDSATRGGPRMGVAGERNIVLNLSSNPARKVGGSFFIFHEVDDLERIDWESGFTVRWQPSERLNLFLEPSWALQRGNRQYVATRDGGSQATFGSRYIFASIDRSQLSAPIRLNYTFKPDLTLEVYAEPFAASGRYEDFGELEEAGGLALREYDADPSSSIMRDDSGYAVTSDGQEFRLPDPDFRVVSFRSNVVLRWEWRAGSTVYLVWQQDRSNFVRDGDLVRPGSLWDALEATGDNFFGVKLSYWFPVD